MSYKFCKSKSYRDLKLLLKLPTVKTFKFRYLRTKVVLIVVYEDKVKEHYTLDYDTALLFYKDFLIRMLTFQHYDFVREYLNCLPCSCTSYTPTYLDMNCNISFWSRFVNSSNYPDNWPYGLKFLSYHYCSF